MATGRMLQQKISNNKSLPRLIALLDERLGAPNGAMAALLYTWCIAHLDVEGRMSGDPHVVKGNVVPRIPFITADVVAVYLDTMNEIGLVIYYEAEDDLWLEFPAFKDSQPGLRHDREKSTIPSPQEGRRLRHVDDAEPPQEGGDARREHAGTLPADCPRNAGQMPP
jgi:hypothetical protein